MSDYESILAELIAELRRFTGDSTVGPETRLFVAMANLDSLDGVEFVMFIEEHFTFDFPDSMVADRENTVADVAREIWRQQGGR